MLFALWASTSLVIWTAALQPARGEKSGQLTESLPRPVAATRQRLLDSLDDPSLGERSESLLSALLLGSRECLGRELREAYSYLGIAHFLALSGLHLGIISLPLAWMIARLPIGKIAGMVCLLLLLTLYTILAGLPPSLVRATALAAAFMLQRSIGRKTTLARSLILALLVLVLMDERILWSGGFQLSCAAVLAIDFLGLPMIRLIRSRLTGRMGARIITLAVAPVVITISVTIFTLPIQLLFFGRAPLLAPVYNLLMILPVTLLLYLGLVYAVIPVAAFRGIISPPIDLIADLLWEVPLRLSTNPQPAFLSGSICWPLYLTGIGLLVAALDRRCGKRVACLLTAAALLVGSLAVGGERNGRSGLRGGNPPGRPIDITRSVTLLSCDLLVIEKDIGRWEAERVASGLWKLGIGHIETILLCPARLGRRRGVEHILYRIEVAEILCSPYLAGYDAGLLELLRARGIRTIFIAKNDTIEAGGRTVRLHAPCYPPPDGKGVPMERACIRYELAPYVEEREFEN